MAPTLVSKTYEPMDVDEFTELAYREGWTDGLPVLPPTEKAVTAILDYLGIGPGKVIGVLPPAEGIATIEKIAINCAMAGCKPEYVPVVITAIQAMLADEFELLRVNSTTGGPAPAAVISGPVVKRLGFDYGEGTVGGSGSRVNGTIGRAIRLVLWNIAQSRPGALSASTFGHIGRYSYVMAERPPDDGNPWEQFHVTAVDLGTEDSAVTMFPSRTQDQISDGVGNNTLENKIAVLADSITLGTSQKMLVVNPHVANAFAGAGWTKKDFRDAIMARAVPWRSHVTTEAVHERSDYQGQLTLPSAAGPRTVREELHILVTGGWSAAPGYCLRLTSSHGQQATRKIDWTWE
ncbi:MAG: hypothetical protein QF714_02335 [Dehalococcoidia bacterium]|jgi:hypothetical protein|nr:hypothetical protein [Dehalococcoidia bacterium]MDP6226535.1 hypothetical protein [Dehalococcoidia bacterium]MDP7201760.1 hypothetical protein [Dehalococcoidia bacterium]HJN85623.1 hypothetical protein [Dehalococcoidia bacterium]